MRFEEWLQLVILNGSDPDNENQVAIGSRLRPTITTVYFVNFRAFRSYAVASMPIIRAISRYS